MSHDEVVLLREKLLANEVKLKALNEALDFCLSIMTDDQLAQVENFFKMKSEKKPKDGAQ